MTQQKWQRETEALRAILVGCGLDEETKWGKPCFAFEGKNVAIIQAFKEQCALMFFKGVLLEDPKGLLRSQGANSQSAMRLEFTREGYRKSGKRSDSSAQWRELHATFMPDCATSHSKIGFAA